MGIGVCTTKRLTASGWAFTGHGKVFGVMHLLEEEESASGESESASLSASVSASLSLSISESLSESVSLSASVSASESPESESASNSPESASASNSPESESVSNSPESVSASESPESISASESPESVSTSESPESISLSESPESLSASESLESVSASESPESISASESPESVSASESPESLSGSAQSGSLSESGESASASNSPESASVSESGESISASNSLESASASNSPESESNSLSESVSESVVAKTPHYSVYGAGTSAVNGGYEEDGTNEGAPAFNNGTYWLYKRYDGIENYYWCIDTVKGDATPLYETISSLSHPPLGTWSGDNYPTIARALTVSGAGTTAVNGGPYLAQDTGSLVYRWSGSPNYDFWLPGDSTFVLAQAGGDNYYSCPAEADSYDTDFENVVWTKLTAGTNPVPTVAWTLYSGV